MYLLLSSLRLRLSAARTTSRRAFGTEIFRLLPNLEKTRIYQTPGDFRVRHELAEDDVELFLSTKESELHQALAIIRKGAILVRPGVKKEPKVAAFLVR